MSHKTTDQFSGKKDGVYRMLTIVVKISETLGVSLKEALDMFYRSETCRRFHDEETGLYLQGNLYVLNDFLAEISR